MLTTHTILILMYHIPQDTQITYHFNVLKCFIVKWKDRCIFHFHHLICTTICFQPFCLKQCIKSEFQIYIIEELIISITSWAFLPSDANFEWAERWSVCSFDVLRDHYRGVITLINISLVVIVWRFIYLFDHG